MEPRVIRTPSREENPSDLTEPYDWDSPPLYHRNPCMLDNTTISSLPTLKPRNEFSSPISKPQFSEHKTPSKYSGWISTWITDWWGLELISWLISALSLLAIVVMLETHKNKPLPEWPLKITLNSFISIFTQMALMGMMKPVVECISQLKWIWFVRKEKLTKFGLFDDASRGPTGSLYLLKEIGGLHLISLGAIITVISIAFGPFSQQVVTYPPRLQPVGNATAPSVVAYIGPSQLSSVVLDVGIIAAIDGGLVSDILSLSTIAPNCSTGNCTFEEYFSIGICPKVVDLSASIIRHQCSQTSLDAVFEAQSGQNPGYPCYNYTLDYESLAIDATLNSSKFSFQIENASLSNLITPVPFVNDSISMEVMKLTVQPSNTSVISSIMIYQPEIQSGLLNSSLSAPVAYLMTFDFCLHTYKTAVRDGVPSTILTSSRNFDLAVEQFLQTNPLGIAFSFPANTTHTADTTHNTTNGSPVTTITVHGQNFSVSSLAAMSLNGAIQDDFLGQCEQAAVNLTYLESTGNSSSAAVCTSLAGTSIINAIENGTDPLSAVTNMMENIATSITNAFRAGVDGETRIVHFQGLALAPVNFVETQYQWLILPIALVSLTLVFLLATISKSQRLGSRVWKSSNLATLQGLHINLQAKLGGLSSITEMEEKAENIKVRFDMEGGKVEHGVEYRLVEEKLDQGWGS